MTTTQDLITDAQINAVWENANFGDVPRRDIIDETILKCASGYHSGYTAQCIVRELGLVSPKKWELTALGRKYLYEAFVKSSWF
jgi:hypothetical protein